MSDEDSNALKGVGVLTALVAVIMWLTTFALYVGSEWATSQHTIDALLSTGRALAILGGVFAVGSIVAFAASRRK